MRYGHTSLSRVTKNDPPVQRTHGECIYGLKLGAKPRMARNHEMAREREIAVIGSSPQFISWGWLESRESQRLEKYDIVAKMSKPAFFVGQVEFWSPLTPCPYYRYPYYIRRLMAVEKWGKPKSFTGLRSFMGVFNRHGIYLDNLALLASPVFDILKIPKAETALIPESEFRPGGNSFRNIPGYSGIFRTLFRNIQEFFRHVWK